jgi:hypothetical protein
MFLIYIFAGRIFGMTLLLAVRYFELKNKAKQKSMEFHHFQQSNHNEWDDTIRQIAEMKDYNPIAQFIDRNTSIYLLEKNDARINIHALNNNQKRICTHKKYCQLEQQFQNRKIVSQYNMDKALIYYRLEQPYSNYILLLEYAYTGNVFKTKNK